MRRGGDARGGAAGFPVAALGAALFWAGLVWAVHRESPRTLVSFHGTLHAAVAGRFMEPHADGFPPENPFFAGRPLPYYWFFHYLAARISRGLGWNVFHSMEALILLATAALAVAGVALGRLLFRSTAAGLLAGFLIFAGTNPFGIAFAVARIPQYAARAPSLASSGPAADDGGGRILETAGTFLRDPLGTLARTDDPDYFWGVVHPLYSLIRFHDFGGLYGPLVNFFLNLTSRPVALGCLALEVLLLVAFLARRRLRALAGLGAACAMTTLLSPIIGISSSGALLLGVLAGWLPAARTAGAARAALLASLALVAGPLAASPTFVHLFTGPSESHVRLWLFAATGVRHLGTLAVAGGPLVILALLGLRQAERECRASLRPLVAAALVLLGADLTLSLPAGNHANFFHAAVVLLAVPASASVLRPAGGAGLRAAPVRLVLVVLLFLPTFSVLLLAYVRRPPVALEFSGMRAARADGSPWAQLYHWAHESTPPAAVFVTDPRRRETVCGNTSELPALTARSLFTEAREHYLVHPYPDAGRRQEIALALTSGARLSAPEAAYLEGLGRPVYVIVHAGGRTAGDGQVGEPGRPATGQNGPFAALYGAPAFRSGELEVYRWSRRRESEEER